MIWSLFAKALHPLRFLAQPPRRCVLQLRLTDIQLDILLSTSMNKIESLPVELIADILGELDLRSLIIVSYLSRRLHVVASDSSLNPWRRPILRSLLIPPEAPYDPCLGTLSVRTTVPRQNWIEIMSLARADWLLFHATPAHLKEAEWEECFKRRFLPSWSKWKKEDGTWKSAFRTYAALPERACASLMFTSF